MWQTISPHQCLSLTVGLSREKCAECLITSSLMPNLMSSSAVPLTDILDVFVYYAFVWVSYVSVLKRAISPFFNHFHVSGICSSSFRLFLRYSGSINAKCLPICTAMFIMTVQIWLSFKHVITCYITCIRKSIKCTKT